MNGIFGLFKLKLIPGSIQRVQMTDEEYFGDEYKDYISNSKLGLLNPAQGGSPQKFLSGFKSSGKSNAFSLGSAVHQMTLEENDYTLSDQTKPSGKLGLVYDKYIDYISKGNTEEKSLVLAALDSDYYTNEIINSDSDNDLPSRLKTAKVKIDLFKKAQEVKMINNKKVIYLSSDLYAKGIGCIKSLKENVSIQKALKWTNSFCEDVVMCDVLVTFPKSFKDPEGEQVSTIMKIKIKIDNWTINHESKVFVLNDLKTTGKPVQYFMGYEIEEEDLLGDTNKIFKNGSFQTFFYARQMGMYLWLLKEYIKQEYGADYKCSANMLVVETIPAYKSNIFPVSEKHIKEGFNEFKDLLKRAAFHQVNGYEEILELAIHSEDTIEINELSL